jgi:hypothetical protein
MKRINVIDLDDTLLPYDSFRVLIKGEIKKLNLGVWFWVVCRKLRLISGALFKEKLSSHFNKKYPASFYKCFAAKLHKDLDPLVLDLVLSKTDINTINVLISASPDLYVKELISLLGWEGKGSFFSGSNFIHLHGNEKLEWLLNNYSKENFEYNFSISDSLSDSLLLEQFKNSIFWTK